MITRLFHSSRTQQQHVQSNTANLLLCALAALCISVSVLPANAEEKQEWVPLVGQKIRLALEGRTVKYTDSAGATQKFESDGSTVYIEGRPSLGSWRVSDSQYCSVWPPASNWVCYDVFTRADKQMIRFVSESGRVYTGRYTP